MTHGEFIQGEQYCPVNLIRSHYVRVASRSPNAGMTKQGQEDVIGQPRGVVPATTVGADMLDL